MARRGIFRDGWGPFQRRRRTAGTPAQGTVAAPKTRELRRKQITQFRKPYFPPQRHRRFSARTFAQPPKSGRTAREIAWLKAVKFRVKFFPRQRKRRFGFRFFGQPARPAPRNQRELARLRITLFRKPFWPRRNRRNFLTITAAAVTQFPGRMAREVARLKSFGFRRHFFPRQRKRWTFAPTAQPQPSGKTARERATIRARRKPWLPRQRKRFLPIIVTVTPAQPRPPRVAIPLRVRRKAFFPRQRHRFTFARSAQPAKPWKLSAGIKLLRIRRKRFQPAQRKRRVPIIRAPVAQQPKPVRREFLANLLRHWKIWRPRPLRKAFQFLVPPPPPPPPPPAPTPTAPNGRILAVDAAFGASTVKRQFLAYPFVQPIRVGDSGVTLMFDVGVLSIPTKNPMLQLIFGRPDGSTLTISNFVYLGGNDSPTPLGSFLGNSFAVYVFAPGDLSQAGVWTVELAVNAMIVSAVGNFVVEP